MKLMQLILMVLMICWLKETIADIRNFGKNSRCFLAMKSSTSSTFFEAIGKDISNSIGVSYRPVSWEGGYGSGGGGATTGTITDTSGVKFFVKQGGLYDFNMLQAEYLGIKEIYDTNTIRVPKPICVGTSDYNAYVVFEQVNLLPI